MEDVTTDELAARLGEPGLVLLDVRTPPEYAGGAGHPCDPRQGHIPGARNVPHVELLPASRARLRDLLGEPDGGEIVCYCHGGSRSALAVAGLLSAGYRARNYKGSWHEWSRRDDLPAETG